MPYGTDDARLKTWCDALDKDYSIHRDAWNLHDHTIMLTVSDYNTWLDRKQGFSRLDWMMVKAQAWVETGANDPAWHGNVLQIGKHGDPGLHDFMTLPNARLVLPPQYKPFLSVAAAQTVPLYSIRAGVGYLLYRMAYFGLVNQTSPEPPLPVQEWKPPETGGASNTPPQPRRPPPMPRKVLGITGWRPITLQAIAARYNAGGDGNYYGKLAHAFDIVVKGVPKGAGK